MPRESAYLDQFPCIGATCRYFLARAGQPGGNMGVQLVDGCHDSPEGVAEAAKLMSRIFRDEGPWVMVEIHPMPDLDPPISEADADLCRAAVDALGQEGEPKRQVKPPENLADRGSLLGRGDAAAVAKTAAEYERLLAEIAELEAEEDS